MRGLNQDAWMVGFVAYPAGAALAYILYPLASRFPGLAVADYTGLLLGNWPGRAAGITIVLFLMQTTIMNLRDYAELLLLNMPQTPMVVFLALPAVLSYYVLRDGIEVLARVAQILLIPVALIILMGLAASFNSFDPQKLLPVLENGPGPVLQSSLIHLLHSNSLLMLLFILPLARGKKIALKYFSYYFAVAGLFFMVVVIFVISTFSPADTHRVNYKLFSLFQDYTGIQGSFLFIWVAVALVRITLLLYMIIRGLAAVLKLRSHKELILPTAVVTISLAIYSFNNFYDYYEHSINIYPVYAAIAELGIPLLLLSAMLLKKKRAG